MRRVHLISWGYDADANGVPLALVIFTDRTAHRFYHHELGA